MAAEKKNYAKCRTKQLSGIFFENIACKTEGGKKKDEVKRTKKTVKNTKKHKI